MTIRKVFFWMHLTAGATACAVILIMCVTGAMLAYEKQILAWAERDYRTVAIAPSATRLSHEEILAKAKDAGVPTNMT